MGSTGNARVCRRGQLLPRVFLSGVGCALMDNASNCWTTDHAALGWGTWVILAGSVDHSERFSETLEQIHAWIGGNAGTTRKA